jgi:hypothetical protein
MNCNKATRLHHPLDSEALKLRLRAKDNAAPVQLTQCYQSLIGKLLYPMSQLRTDIAFAVGYLARTMINPTELYHQYALQVLDHLYTTKDLVIRCAAQSVSSPSTSIARPPTLVSMPTATPLLRTLRTVSLR